MMEKNAKIYVAGHRGMVGSAIVRELQRQGYTNIITRTHKELDLCRQEDVERFFAEEKPEYVFLAAAKVGGIVANQEALADFMWFNMTLEMNVIHSAWQNGCKKLEFLGSSCIYPRMAPQPMKESCLLTSELEKTNEAYALAKISGLKYCEFLNRQYGTDYISVMPTNLYGPNDNYHPTHSHVVPALIRRFHEAKVNGVESVTCWGDGSPLREFLYVDDLANLCVFLMNNYSGNETVNAGTGKELTIKELTELVAKVVGYTGEIKWDTSKPNGTPRKLLDVSKATNLGWTYRTELEDGLRLSYEDFLTQPDARRALKGNAMNIILLSGGSGKRLWPLSNDIRSKQFIKIFKTDDGYESMVQRVYRQIKEVDADASVTIATSKTQVSSIHNQLGNSVGVCVAPAAAIPSRQSHWPRPFCTM